jgi:hypothetical protein
MTSRFVSVATFGLVCAFSAAASPIFIPVVNFSFEIPPAGGLTTGCGTGCAFSAGAIPGIPGWSGSTATSGEFQPGTQTGNLAFFSTLSNGITSAFADTAGTILSQTVGATVQVGATYTLRVDLGARRDLPFGASADLRINGHLFTATGITPTPGNWSTFTATYLGVIADANDSITIELVANRRQGNFDNVRLDVAAPISAVLEPNSVGFLGLGLAGLLVFARRNRASWLS